MARAAERKQNPLSVAPRARANLRSGLAGSRQALIWTASRKVRERDGLRHPSDQTDQEWAAAKPIVCVGKYATADWEKRLRDNLDAILYVLSTGCKWRQLPREFPPNSTAYAWLFLRWHCDGVLERLNFSLYEQGRRPTADRGKSIVGVGGNQGVKSARKEKRVAG